MRSLFVVLIVAIGLHIGASLAQASCRQQTLAEQAARADVVAVGHLSGDRLEIRQVLKGQASGTIQVRLRPEGNVVTSVDYMPKDDTDQTLYLRREGSDNVTDACSGSHEGAPTAEERAFFGVDAPLVATGGEATSTNIGIATSTGLVLALAALAVGAFALFVVLRSRRKAVA